jgi:hypothetical protein
MFLYPADTDAGDVATITEMAEGEMDLVPVGNIDEALEVLLDGDELTGADLG